jgi:hypothetical protein
MQMRDLMNIINEDASSLADIDKDKDAQVSSLMSALDVPSAAHAMEMYGEDDEVIAEAWFDRCLSIYKRILRLGKCPIYRHMMVDDFAYFIQSVRSGAAIGEHWSINPDIESPTWKQDQRGDIPVLITGMITADQIDWERTLYQNFEWPHESEIIFSGDVFVETIYNQDTDKNIKIGANVPR